MKYPILWTLILVGGCAMSPVSNQIEPGKDPFVVFVAEGADSNTDLFVAQPGGGPVLQLTYTPILELAPSLTPDGSVVAFLRMKDTLPGTHREITLMSISRGNEYRLKLPSEAGTPLRLAWSDDLQWIYAATDEGVWKLAVPPLKAPAARLSGTELAEADSALTNWVGRPRFARVVPCIANGVCLALPNGDTTSLSSSGRDAFPWGSDSVAWFTGNRLTIRSLGGGNLREIQWSRAPSNPRQASYASIPSTD